MTDWLTYFPNIRLTTTVRPKQAAIFSIAANVQSDNNETIRWLAELCTGYGKTIVSLGVFWILKQRGLITKALHLIPTDAQRTAMFDDRKEKPISLGDISEFNQMFGVKIRGHMITKKSRDLRVVRENKADYLVACYQQFSSKDEFFAQLIELAVWMMVLDECHHLSEENKLAIRQNRLDVRVRLGLSATPGRSDGMPLLGLPEEAIVHATYKEAWGENVVKGVRGHDETFSVSILNEDGTTGTLTTKDLKKEGITEGNYDKYEAKRQLRYNPGYLDKILVDAIYDFHDRVTKNPPQPNSKPKDSVIVFCMSCKHANTVSDQINNFCRSMSLPYKADWIGVGQGLLGKIKDDKTNEKIINDFKAGRIHILVQVSKCAEGFNAPSVSVICFLHLIAATNRLLQQLGRGLRRRMHIKDRHNDILSVYFSSDTEIGKLVEEMEADSTDKNTDTTRTGGSEPRFEQIRDWFVANAKHTGTEFVMPKGVAPLSPDEEAWRLKYGIPLQEYLSRVRGFAKQDASESEQSPMNEGELIEQCRTQAEKALKIFCRNIIGLHISNNGLQLSQREISNTIGRVKAVIHRQWIKITGNRHDEMLADDFKAKHKLIQGLNLELQEKGIPAWIQEAINQV